MKSVNQQMQWFGVESCAGRVNTMIRMCHFRVGNLRLRSRFDPMWLDQVEPRNVKS